MSGNGVVRRAVEVVNARGLHARVAAKIAATAEEFDAEITFDCKGHAVSAQSIMGLLMLGAAPGTRLEISGTGAEAASAIETFAAMFAAGFEEE